PRLRRVDVAQGADEAPGALVRLVLGRLVAGAFGGALRTQFRAPRTRFVAFGVQGLRHAGGAAGVAQGEHGRFEDLAGTLDPEHFSASQRTRRFGALPVDLDLAGLDRLPRQAAGLVEARRPQPQVEADGVVLFG